MNYAIEMRLGAMTYIPNFIKTGSGIQKLLGGGGYRHTGSKVISYAYFYFFKIRKVG
jgi:hypothetical protein